MMLVLSSPQVTNHASVGSSIAPITGTLTTANGVAGCLSAVKNRNFSCGIAAKPYMPRNLGTCIGSCWQKAEHLLVATSN